MEQCGQELDSFEEQVKKAVDAKAKAALRLDSYACKTDQSCLRRSRPSAAKASTQGQPMKDPRVEEPKKSQELKAPAPQRSDSFETSEQAHKGKKKKNKQHRGQKRQKCSTLATKVNNTSAKRSRPQKNISQVPCFNCNKKRHYSNKCPKPSKS